MNEEKKNTKIHEKATMNGKENKHEWINKKINKWMNE